MAALLEEDTIPYPRLRRGEIIEGVVVGTDRDGILVDVGAKSEGVVPPHEMHCLRPEGPSRLSQGDKVLVFVLQPESPEGQIILSLDRARGERGWRVLQEYLDQNKAFEAYVTGSNKGGLLVNVEGVNAFVPLSQIVGGPERGSTENTERALGEWVGKTILLKVIELNRRRNRAILSERAAVQERRASEKERLLLELREGDIRSGRITSIRDFGIFVDLGGADGLVHLSELSWERTPKSPHELFRVGDEVEVYILKVDQENKKIALSVRRAQPQRWEEIVSRYREGQIVPGQVTKLAPFGAFVRLEGPIEGLIHISELVDRRINHPREVIDENDPVPVKIVRIEHDRHRLGLSLRQARDKAEDDGWTFSDDGRVLSAPEDILAQLGITLAPRQAEAQAAELEAEAEAPEAEAAVEPEAVAEAPEAEAALEPEALVEVPEAIEAPAADLEAEAEAPEVEAAVEPEGVAEAPEEVEAPAAEPEAEAALEPEALVEAPEAIEAPAAELEAEAEAPEAEAAVEPEAVAEAPEEAEAPAAEPEAEAAVEPEAVAEAPEEAEALAAEPEAEAALESEALVEAPEAIEAQAAELEAAAEAPEAEAAVEPEAVAEAHVEAEAPAAEPEAEDTLEPEIAAALEPEAAVELVAEPEAEETPAEALAQPEAEEVMEAEAAPEVEAAEPEPEAEAVAVEEVEAAVEPEAEAEAPADPDVTEDAPAAFNRGEDIAPEAASEEAEAGSEEGEGES